MYRSYGATLGLFGRQREIVVKKRVVNDPQVRNYGPKMGGSGNVGENVWGLLAVKTVKM